MKTRDSGMPHCESWDSFFDPDALLRALDLHWSPGLIVDIGCGYGTFSLPAARLTGQRVLALDIDEDVLAQLTKQADIAGLSGRIDVCPRDVIEVGTGLADGAATVALLFNLLHCEQPVALLREAHRILAPAGRVGVIHWRRDVPTPRGPDLSIRPTTADLVNWLASAGFVIDQEPKILEPYHVGVVGRRE